MTYLWDKILGKLGVSQYQLQVFLFHNAVYNKWISLSDCDQSSDQITNPRWVDEIEVVQTAELVIVMKEDAVLMKKPGS